MSIDWLPGQLDSDLSDSEFATLAVRAGQRRGPEGEHGEAIFTTSSYVFRDAAHAAACFAGDEPGNVYSRYTNPTVRTFEERLAALEAGEKAVATASGMSAIMATVMSFCSAGDHVLVSRSIFGATVSLFDKYLARFGIETTYVDIDNPQAWRDARQPNTRMLYLESPSNPLAELADIAALAEVAREAGALLVVDNCFCTPALQQPLKLGADIVVHSATKYIDGQGRCIGGAVVGDAQRVGKDVFGFLRTAGPTMSPFNAWVFSRGLETLSLRMRAHSENAMAIAQWLREQPGVARVFYPGLSDHPQHELAKRQQRAFGGIVSFELEGGRDEAWRLVDALQTVSITGNLGDVKSTITHPSTTTHARNTPEQRAAAGITEGLLRMSVGLEEVDDLMRDL